jgi:hypothetical protein
MVLAAVFRESFPTAALRIRARVCDTRVREVGLPISPCIAIRLPAYNICPVSLTAG